MWREAIDPQQQFQGYGMPQVSFGLFFKHIFKIETKNTNISKILLLFFLMIRLLIYVGCSVR